MSKFDIICFVAIMSFVSICFGGIAVGATWSIVTASQDALFSSHISNGFAAFVGVEGAAVCLFLSYGLWMNPDHDAVLGRC
jgi:hypothetical protein